MNVGERIKNRRKELGISAENLAERIGKSPATIYRYEKGDIRNVDSTVLLPIAKALHVSPAYLMGWEESAEPSPAIPDDNTDLLYAMSGEIADLTEDEQAAVQDFIRYVKSKRNAGDNR